MRRLILAVLAVVAVVCPCHARPGGLYFYWITADDGAFQAARKIVMVR